MPRQLVLVPHPGSVLLGAQMIGPGYTKPYTAREMRTWAEDLDRLYHTSSSDLARWRSMPPDQLTPEARRTLAVQDKYFVEAERGIKGDLRDDGRIELYGGTHRAGYLLERGTDPVPVWVSDQDPQRLAAFRRECHDEVNRTRPGILARDDEHAQTRTSTRIENYATEHDRPASVTEPDQGPGQRLTRGAVDAPAPRPCQRVGNEATLTRERRASRPERGQ